MWEAIKKWLGLAPTETDERIKKVLQEAAINKETHKTFLYTTEGCVIDSSGSVYRNKANTYQPKTQAVKQVKDDANTINNPFNNIVIGYTAGATLSAISASSYESSSCSSDSYSSCDSGSSSGSDW